MRLSFPRQALYSAQSIDTYLRLILHFKDENKNTRIKLTVLLFNVPFS